MVAVGSGIESSRATLALAEEHDGVFAAIGIHPHQAGHVPEETLAELTELIRHPKAVAVGETGLDFFRDYAPRSSQQELFEAQVRIASDTGKPVVVHSRAADAETVALLERLPNGVTVVLHCFSSVGLLAAALERGWYVSFAGNVTFPNARELRWAAEQVPDERLLAETDTPYLAPQPVRGKPNEPAYVVHTLAALAEARGVDADALERTIDENASRAFGLP